MSKDSNKILSYSPESALKNPGRLLGDMCQDLMNSRDLAFRLFQRNLKSQFRQSILGYVWLFIQPLTTTLLWVLLKSGGAVQIGDVGIPYVAYVLIGSLLYQVFSDAMNSPLRELNAAKPMLIKLNFPREAPILAGLYMTAFTSVIRLILLIPIFFLVDLHLTANMVWFPLGYISLVILGLSFGLILTPIGLLYNDVSRAIGLSLQLGLYATPVVFAMAKSGPHGWIMKYNPVTYLLSTTRDFLTGGTMELLIPACYICGGAFILLFIGWTVFRIVIPIIIERLGM